MIFEILFDVTSLKDKIDKLEMESMLPSFWDDTNEAQKVLGD